MAGSMIRRIEIGVLLTFLAVFDVAQGATQAPQNGQTERRPAAPRGQVFNYNCEGGRTFTVQMRADGLEVRIVLPDGKTVVLPHVISADGARYSNGEVTYWSRGRGALLETGDEDLKNCVESATATGESVAGTQWRIVEANGRTLKPVHGPQRTPSLSFAEGGRRISGFSGCNRFFGNYTQAGEHLKFDKVGGTKMACMGEVMQTEQDILRALERVDRFRIAGDQLELLTGDQALLRLQRTYAE
jgi:heat shock protein HslJ